MDDPLTESKKAMSETLSKAVLRQSMEASAPEAPVMPVAVELKVGETIDVKGVECEVVHINPGKGRITLRPLGTMTNAKKHGE